MTEDLKFVSDPVLFGRHIAALRASDNALVRSYVWGLDLSGSLDGAGGVGGLLWMTQHTGQSAGTHFAAYDGNGNIVALSAASDGSETARYEYGPFGEPIRVTGPMAKENPFRFSTKRTDNTTDLVLYEYRAYSPSLGRWLSRDPIGERGGDRMRQQRTLLRPHRVGLSKVAFLQSYGFCHNDGVGMFDVLGLFRDGGGGPGTDNSGHADFANVTLCPFDYTLEDRGGTAPYPPGGDPERHFRDLPVSAEDVRVAIERCDADAFQRAMHRGQDYFVHFRKGYRWDPWNSSLPCWGFGHFCEPEADFDAAAWEDAEAWTRTQLEAWLRNCCVPRCGRLCAWAKRATTFCHPRSP